MNQRHSSPADMASGRKRLVESTLELLAFDTQNPPGETTVLLAWLEGVIQGWDVDTEAVYRDPRTRPSVVSGCQNALVISCRSNNRRSSRSDTASCTDCVAPLRVNNAYSMLTSPESGVQRISDPWFSSEERAL